MISDRTLGRAWYTIVFVAGLLTALIGLFLLAFFFLGIMGASGDGSEVIAGLMCVAFGFGFGIALIYLGVHLLSWAVRLMVISY